MRKPKRNEDLILIPSEKGFISIPAEGLRSQEVDHAKQSRLSLNLFFMKAKNYLQFIAIAASMTGIMAYLGYTIGGMTGMIAAFFAAGLGLIFSSNFSISHFLRKKGVQLLHPHQGGVLYEMISELANRAKLEKTPVLFVDNAPEINAFTVEDKNQAAIVISKGLINNLTKQEMFGVLAHEVAHLKNNDIRIMLFLEQIRKLTGYMSLFGQFVLIVSLPFLLINQVVVPWLTLLILVMAPTISLLFQIAISRNREFRADMDAVLLAEDSKGLSQALTKIRLQTNLWKRFYTPYIRNIPEILRTHPNTKERIQRLKELEQYRNNELGWS